MAFSNKLNPEEQQSLAAVGHFWQSWGMVLTAAVVAVLLGIGGWKGYGWYQTRQAAQAAIEMEKVVQDARMGDTEKLATSLKSLQGQFSGTAQAQQASLLAARIFYEKGQADKSQAALTFAAGSAADKGLQSAAKLQLAALLIEQKQYDQAIQQVSSNIEPGYEALAADRKGDAYALQGKNTEAIEAYSKAFKTLSPEQPYRQLVAMKLDGLGVDPATLLAAAATANATNAASAADKAASSASSVAASAPAAPASPASK